MPEGLKTIIFPVRDLARAKSLFTQLAGTPPYADQPYYVAFTVAGQDVGLDPNGHAKGLTGPVAYWHVSDIEASLQALLDAGAHTLQEPTDVGGGTLIASVKDPDGNPIGLFQEA